MIQKNKALINDPILLFFVFLFSSITAFINSIIWLSPIIVLIDTILLSVCVFLCIWNLRRLNILANFIIIIKRNWIVLPFLIYAGFSVFWSISQDISFYRWLILVFTIIIGGYIGLKNNIDEIIWSLSVFCLCIVLLSFLLVIFIPDIGVMNYHDIQGAWKGIYWHKNHMGLIASFSSVLFLLNITNSFRVKQNSLYFWILFYIISLLSIYKTDSVAAYITTLIINGSIFLALVWLKIRNKIQKHHYIILIIILVVISIVLFMNIDRFFGVFNRNITLTGRIPMWTLLYNKYISERPYLGYGFNAFWYQESNRVGVQEVGYADPIVIADNGFIDMLVNTGFIGLFLFLIFYLNIYWRSIKYAWRADEINGFFPLVVMSFTLIANISWSLIYENESFFMLIMISILFFLSKTEYKKIVQSEQPN